MISNNVTFSKSERQVKWQGILFPDKTEFKKFLKGPVYNRLIDAEIKSSFESEMANLATTRMAQDTLKKLLSSEPESEPWEIGEAIAECVLEEERKIQWPWNMERDKRTPKASLPGADLIGLIEEGGDYFILLGEVKTSEDPSRPPQVLYGRSGMICQLDELACNLRIHSCLLTWLFVRCKDTPLWPLYQKAMKNYLQSQGKELILMGILLRSARPDEGDLKSRVSSLVEAVEYPTKVELLAWYLPQAINEWPTLIKEKQA